MVPQDNKNEKHTTYLQKWEKGNIYKWKIFCLQVAWNQIFEFIIIECNETCKVVDPAGHHWNPLSWAILYSQLKKIPNHRLRPNEQENIILLFEKL